MATLTNDTIIKTNELLGEGATSQVFKGYIKHTGEPVAVKRYKDCAKRQLIKREINTLIQLKEHKNIIRVLYSKESEANSYIVLEYCNGPSMDDFMKKKLKYQAGLRVDLFHKALLDISAGYEHLHNNKLAHRDIKPDNIMLMYNPDGTKSFKIGDLGSSKEVSDETVDDPSKKLHTIVGKEEYMDTFILERYLKRINKNMDGKKNFTFKVKLPKSKERTKVKEMECYNKNVDLWSIGCTLIFLACNCFAFSCSSNVNNPLRLILEMHKNRQEHHIMSMVVNTKEIEHSSEFRNASPMYRHASKELQEHYKKIIRYCFKKGSERSTEMYFKLVDEIRCKSLCYYMDLNQGYGYYDMNDAAVDINTNKFKVPAVSQFAKQIRSDIDVVFLASSINETCTPKKPFTSQIKTNLEIATVGVREALLSSCPSFESGFSNYDTIMFNLQLINQLALVAMFGNEYNMWYKDLIRKLRDENYQEVLALRKGILNIWKDLKPLLAQNDIDVGLTKVTPAFLETFKKANLMMKQYVVSLVTTVYGNPNHNKHGFIKEFCELLLKVVKSPIQVRFIADYI